MSNKEEKKLVPKLRFPEFQENDGWSYLNGNILFEQIVNKNHKSDLQILAITQEQGAVPRSEIDYHVTVTDKSVESYKVVEVGDFIISLRSFQGGIEYSNYKGLCSPAYIILRKKKDVDNVFFKYYFKTDQFIKALNKNLEGIRDGKMVSYKQFSDLFLPEPSPEEQQKVADCLSSFDNLVAAESEKLAALKAHKKGLMQQLFPAEGETVPQLRFAGFKGEWEEKKLDDIAKRGSGHTPSKSKPENYNGGVKWVSLADLKRLDQGLITQTAIEISTEGIKNSSAVLHPTGTVLISRDAGIGKSAVMETAMAVSQHFIVWICNGSVLNNWFLYHLLQKSKPLFERAAIGSTIKTIGLQFFKDLALLIPSLSEQEKIADCLSSLDALITAQCKKIDALKLHKKGLMQGLFPSINDVEP